MVNPPRAGAGGVSRRTALKAFSAGAVALLPSLSHDGLLAFGRLQAAQAPPNPKVLSQAQFATLETLVEAIIPADDRSPGAKAGPRRRLHRSAAQRGRG